MPRLGVVDRRVEHVAGQPDELRRGRRGRPDRSPSGSSTRARRGRRLPAHEREPARPVDRALSRTSPPPLEGVHLVAALQEQQGGAAGAHDERCRRQPHRHPGLAGRRSREPPAVRSGGQGGEQRHRHGRRLGDGSGRGEPPALLEQEHEVEMVMPSPPSSSGARTPRTPSAPRPCQRAGTHPSALDQAPRTAEGGHSRRRSARTLSRDASCSVVKANCTRLTSGGRAAARR